MESGRSGIQALIYCRPNPEPQSGLWRCRWLTGKQTPKGADEVAEGNMTTWESALAEKKLKEDDGLTAWLSRAD